MNPPANMRLVTKEEFFAALFSDPRDIMAKRKGTALHTTWETKNREGVGMVLPRMEEHRRTETMGTQKPGASVNHQHKATPDTQSHVYEYCECGAVRKLTPNGYDTWHVCDLCRVPGHAAK